MQMSIESNSSVIRRKNDKQQLFGRYSLIADGNMGRTGGSVQIRALIYATQKGAAFVM